MHIRRRRGGGTRHCLCAGGSAAARRRAGNSRGREYDAGHLAAISSLGLLNFAAASGRWPNRSSNAWASRRPRLTFPRSESCRAAISKKWRSARWLAAEPRVLILDEPTQGIDIGAKAEIHRLMGELARQGLAILMISPKCRRFSG